MTRKDALRTLSGMLAAGRAAAAGPDIEVRTGRFMMKGDFPRLEVVAPAWRFVWHGRFFGFRLVAGPYDERISYSNFGPFAVGGLDLISGHYMPLKLAWPDGAEVKFATGRMVPAEGDPHAFLLEHIEDRERRLRMHVRFSLTPPHIRLRFEPAGYDRPDPMLLNLTGNLVFDRTWQQGASSAFFASGAGAGLRVDGEGVSASGTSLVCRLPSAAPSEWALTVLGPRDWPCKPQPSAAIRVPTYRPVRITELKSWEADEMRRRGWSPDRRPVKERVAGLFVTAEGWRHPVSWIPEARIAHVERVMLPKIAACRKFGAVGLSRDGITEKGENPAWLKLVARAHAAGLRVYMKPGDGELTAMRERSQMANWARDCFDVAPEQRCDVVRLPWEAVLVPWTTANVCLEPSFVTPELKRLAGLPWKEAHARVVASVADRFSFIIDAIRRHAPGITIDLESADTLVLEKLLARHDNLGVMYMTYGQYPRAAEYMDLYYCVARRQMRAARVVLESDCYYTAAITGLGQLKGRPYPEMYPQEDIDLMARKHRHMNLLGAEAAWAWGLNMTFTEDKFRAVCEAEEA